MSDAHTKSKQSLYFPEDMLQEIRDEANRQDRSLSWIVQQAWKVARGSITQLPDAPRKTEAERFAQGKFDRPEG